MAVRTVVGPDGRTWKVRRKWLSRSVSWRGPVRPKQAMDVADGFDLLDLGADLPVIGWVFMVLAIVVLIVGGVALLLPLLVFLGELAFVVLLLLAGAAGRILLRRPWTVEARVKGTNEGREWKVVGWRESGDVVERMAERIAATGTVAGDVSWSG